MIRVDRQLNSTDVVDALTDLFILRGPPDFARSHGLQKNECLTRRARSPRDRRLARGANSTCGGAAMKR